jgi:hypothetical protein
MTETFFSAPLQLARRLRAALRELGWLDGSLYALDRTLAAMSGERLRLHKYYFVAQPIREKPWLPPGRGEKLEARWVTASDRIIERIPRPDWAAPHRFGQGAMCLALLKDGTCIGFGWFTLGAYQEDEVRCRYVPLPAGKSVWDFDVYLEPEHRTGIAFLKLWDEANGFFAERDVRWSLSRISAFNKGSLRAHARMGAAPIGSALFLTLGPLQVCAMTCPPFFHFSRSRDSFPTLALDPERTLNRKRTC